MITFNQRYDKSIIKVYSRYIKCNPFYILPNDNTRHFTFLSAVSCCRCLVDPANGVPHGTTLMCAVSSPESCYSCLVMFPILCVNGNTHKFEVY